MKPTQANLAKTLRHLSQDLNMLPKHSGIVVGVSGGPDSVALLFWLLESTGRTDMRIQVAHLNHGIRGVEAERDADFVKDLCARLKVPFNFSEVNVNRIAKERERGIEEAARYARYRFFGQVAAATGFSIVAVGHTANDQAETVLINLIRGTGTLGLSGMRPISKIPGSGLTLIRPFLAVSRQDVLDYLETIQQDYCVDSSNLEAVGLRSRIRHHVLPMLEKERSGTTRRLIDLAEIVSADVEVLAPQYRDSFQEVAREINDAIEFDRLEFRNHKLGARRAILRIAMNELVGQMNTPGFTVLEAARKLVESDNPSARMDLGSHLTLVLNYDLAVISRGSLNNQKPSAGFLLPSADVITLMIPGYLHMHQTEWGIETEIARKDDELRVAISSNRDFNTAYFDADIVGKQLMARPRQSGDRIQPLGMQGKSRKLSDLMIDKKVARNERGKVPVIVTADNDIIWVVGICQSHKYQVTKKTKRILVMRVLRSDQVI